MTISTVLGAALTGVLFASVPIVHVIFKNKPNVLKVLSKVLFPLYLGLLFCMTLLKVNIAQEVSVNFATNGEWMAKTFNWAMMAPNITDFAINIAMVFPLGYASTFFGNHKSKFSLLKGLATGFAVGLTVEVLQFVLPIDRSPSLSDILLNTLSGGIGAGVSIATAKFCDVLDNSKMLKTKAREQKIEAEQLASQKSFEMVKMNIENATRAKRRQTENKVAIIPSIEEASTNHSSRRLHAKHAKKSSTNNLTKAEESPTLTLKQ